MLGFQIPHQTSRYQSSIRLSVGRAEGKREIGYWIDRAFWGRGVATEALSAFLSLEPIRPLHAGVAKHNVASIRVLQKCGFVHFEDDGATHILLKLDAKL